MKHAVLTLLLFLAACGAWAYDYTTVASDPMSARWYTLPNGLTVVLSRNVETPRITAHIAVRTGSRNDPAATTGLAHYLEHLMFKGTPSFGTSDYSAEAPLLEQIKAQYEQYRTLTAPDERKAKYHTIDSLSTLAARYNIPNEYDKMMSLIGSEGTNAYTSNDVTCYVENIPANELVRWCMVQSERFQHMVIRGFHTELEAVYEEKNISMAKDAWKANDALMAKLFPTHAYGTQTTIGTQEHLKNPSIANIEAYFRRYYTPQNVALCLAGDLDPDSAIAVIDRYFGQWQPTGDALPRHFPAQPEYRTPQDTTVLGQETESVMLAWRLAGASTLQCDTTAMIDMLLANGEVGLIDIDLNAKMRTLGAGGGTDNLADYGMLELYGTPNEGQSLEEVRQLLLAEVDKLKRGDWDAALMPAILRNERLSRLRALDNNRSRVSQMVDCFVTRTPWQQHVEQLDRIARLTKADITAWAREHLGDGYVCVYKRRGDDTTLVKIEKPAITPIPANRDAQSQYLRQYAATPTHPIEPQFCDFRDLTFAQTGTTPIIYKHNDQDARFSLVFRYPFGSDADRRLTVAADYLTLLGTDALPLDSVRRRFYDLACNYSVSVADRTTTIALSGLQESMPQALTLLRQLLATARPDTTVYRLFVDQQQKARAEVRTNQQACFNALWAYGLYGDRSPVKDVATIAELRDTPPSTYTDLLRTLLSTQHEALYYGPLTAGELQQALGDWAQATVPAPANKPRPRLTTDANEVWLAPYDAHNAYIRMLSNTNRPWSLDHEAVTSVFNEYFGGSMNAIVFQELREARGLAYSASASWRTPSRRTDTEFYLQQIISQSDKVPDCIRTFAHITDSMPQSHALFQSARDGLLKSVAARRTTRSAVINRYIAMRELGYDRDIAADVFPSIAALTLQDIVHFERDNIKGRPMRYLILGNEADLDLDYLNTIAPVRRLTLDDIFPQ